MKFWMVYGLSWMIGFTLGICLAKIRKTKKTIGTLRIAYSEPNESHYLFLELDQGGMREIEKGQVVSFKVDLRNYDARN